jgi:hypothetical protein
VLPLVIAEKEGNLACLSFPGAAIMIIALVLFENNVFEHRRHLIHRINFERTYHGRTGNHDLIRPFLPFVHFPLPCLVECGVLALRLHDHLGGRHARYLGLWYGFPPRIFWCVRLRSSDSYTFYFALPLGSRSIVCRLHAVRVENRSDRRGERVAPMDHQVNQESHAPEATEKL